MATIQRTRRDGKELRGYLWPTFSICDAEAPADGKREWTPALEVFEKEDKFVMKVELPGMKEEDIDVSVKDDTLTIKGERKSESEVNEEDYYCCERSYGSFFRSIALPSTVDAKEIEASYENGVLEVSLPKAVEVKPKKISVSAKKKTS